MLHPPNTAQEKLRNLPGGQGSLCVRPAPAVVVLVRAAGGHLGAVGRPELQAGELEEVRLDVVRAVLRDRRLLRVPHAAVLEGREHLRSGGMWGGGLLRPLPGSLLLAPFKEWCLYPLSGAATASGVQGADARAEGAESRGF